MVDLAAIGSLLGGLGQFGGGIAGLFRGGGDADRARRDNETFMQNWRNDDLRMYGEQLQWQRDLAMGGIRMRAADAKAAGIHPLYAIGAPPMQASPISISSAQPAGYSSSGGGPDFGAAFANMGQGLGRASQALATKDERMNDHLRLLQIEKANADIELTRAQTASILARSQVGPAMPSVVGRTGLIAGQGDAPSAGGSVSGSISGSAGLGGWENKPPEVTTVSPGNATHQSGPSDPSVRWFRSGGGLVSEPIKSSKAEDEFLSPLMSEWLVRNRVLPFLGDYENKPPMSVVRESFPGATGVYFDSVHFKWMPLYNNEVDFKSRYINWRNRQ